MTGFGAVGAFENPSHSSFRDERDSIYDTHADGVLESTKMAF
jgi:hypothetical protein